MQRLIIIAKGEVQRVGYRDAVQKIARKLGITGYVENLENGDVKIVAEGEENILREFIEKIKINKFPIFVEKIETKFAEPTREFKYFKIKRGDWREELGERFDLAGTLLYRSVELGEKSVELGERSVKLGEKSVELGEKSVELGEKSVKLGEKSVELGERSVKLGEKSVELGEKNLKKLDEIHKDLSINLKAFHQDTTKRFDLIDAKYGKLSDNMYNINNTLKELTKAILKLAENK